MGRLFILVLLVLAFIGAYQLEPHMPATQAQITGLRVDPIEVTINGSSFGITNGSFPVITRGQLQYFICNLACDIYTVAIKGCNREWSVNGVVIENTHCAYLPALARK